MAAAAAVMNGGRLLEGVRVLDLSRVLAGPSLTQHLATLGADVIKVERPGVGDDTRAWGPPFVDAPAGSSYFASCNAGKRSIAVDVANPAGRDLVVSLARKSDLFVENFKKGDLDRRGLGFKDLSAVRPQLVYASVTGYGPSGPLASEPGYDYIAQARTGLMSVTGPADASSSSRFKTGVAVVDLYAGMALGVTAMSAVLRARETGIGCHVESSLYESGAAIMSYAATAFFATGRAPRALGNAHPNIVPYDSIEASDGPVVIACGNDVQFRRLCAVLEITDDTWGDPALAEEVRTNAGRVTRRAEVIDVVSERVAKHTAAEICAILSDSGVLCTPVNDLAAFYGEPQAQHLEIRQTTVSRDGSSVDIVRRPTRVNGGEDEPVPSAPPGIGEHTREVLSDVLGLGDKELADLHAAGAIEM